jgi:hypothetical protein
MLASLSTSESGTGGVGPKVFMRSHTTSLSPDIIFDKYGTMVAEWYYEILKHKGFAAFFSRPSPLETTYER